MVPRKTAKGRNNVNELLDRIMIEAIRDHVKTYRLTNSCFYKSKLVKWIQQPGRVAQLICFNKNKREIASIRIVGGDISVDVPGPIDHTIIFNKNTMDYHTFISHRDIVTALSDMLRAIDNYYNTMERLSRVSIGEAVFTFIHYWAETLNKLKDDFMENHSNDDRPSDDIIDDMVDDVLMSFRNNPEVVGWMSCIVSLFNVTPTVVEDKFIKPYLRESRNSKEDNS